MNFQTKRKKVVKSWKEDQAAVTKKAKPEKESGEKRGRDAEEGEWEARLVSRTKKKRKKKRETFPIHIRRGGGGAA